MKKIIIRILSLALILTLSLFFTSCFDGEDGRVTENETEKNEMPGDTNNGNVAEAPADSHLSALTILEKAWNALPEDKKFPAFGGNAESPVENAPGNFGTGDAEAIDNSLGFPVASFGLIDDAASLTHMMNANTFTAAAYRVKDPASVDTAVKAIDGNLATRQWICGFPEKLAIATVDGRYIVSVFGAAELVDPMLDQIKTSYPSTSVAVNKNME